MASRNRRKTKGKAKAVLTPPPAGRRGDTRVPAVMAVDPFDLATAVFAQMRQPLPVVFRDPAEPPIFARLADEFGDQLADPPATVWGRPADLSRRGMAAAFLELWPGSRHAAMAAADEPTLADDPGPGPDLYTALATPAAPGSWLDDDVTGFLPLLEVAHV